MSNTQKNTRRNSSLELFRILSMFAIVAHHYVVNSGVTQLYDYNNVGLNMLFLLVFGAWGKTAINSFTLITGYFMCKSSWSFQKILKMILQIEFYYVVFYLIFVLTGFTPFNWDGIKMSVFAIFLEPGWRYVGTMLVLYFLIPFINKLIQILSKREYQILLLILLFYFTILPTFVLERDNFDFLFWMVTVYLIGAYVRLHPVKLFENTIFWLAASIISLGICVASIIVIAFNGVSWGIDGLVYYLVLDSNKLGAIAVAFTWFMLFKNIKMPYIRCINTLASTTFGILLIHANSDQMRKFLWVDLFKNATYFDAGICSLVQHAVLVTMLVFFVGALIEWLRMELLEKPMMKLLGHQKTESAIKGTKN